MKTFVISFSILLPLLVGTTLFYTTIESSSREEISINRDWEYRLGGSGQDWMVVDVPHIPKIEPLVVNDQWQGSMWYKKQLDISDPTKKYYLEFEGIMHESEIWVNKVPMGKHYGGYLPFVIDISEHLVFDKPNEIKLFVNNEDHKDIPPGKPLETLDFNYYGGIYRGVNLIKVNPLHITNPIHANKIGSGGIFVHFDEVSKARATGTVKIHVKNDQPKKATPRIELTFAHKNGQSFTFQSEEVALGPTQDHEFLINIDIPNPSLWSVRLPSLYDLQVRLFDDDLRDSFNEKIGIRKIELTNEGFYLNDEKIYIRGTNRHQEYPYVGYAISENANYRDAIKIKQAGFDFVRLSHYPQDEAFLQACDELGLLVMNAIPGWQFFGGETFVNNSYQDIRDMIRRDRNHPSVVFWEVSLNESSMTDEYMVEANKILKEELPFADTYSAGWIDHESFDLYIPARQHGKHPYYWNDYKVNERPLFIAEYGDWEYYAQNAGFNQVEYNDLKEHERTSRQLRIHGEKRLLQQVLNFQEAANSNRKGPNTIGHANWVMFDYNRGYADDIEASGISDIFRIPKFAYYFYQSQRPPEDTLALSRGTGPMVKIASTWDGKSDTRIRVFSNCEEVELYHNGLLVEKKGASRGEFSSHLPYPPFHFDLRQFESGELKAIGYINGEKVSEDIVRTPLQPAGIKISVDLSEVPIAEGRSDIVILYASIIDQNGTIINDSDEEVEFVSENHELIGDNPVKAEAGIASILLKTNGSGEIYLSAKSDSLTNSFKMIIQ